MIESPKHCGHTLQVTEYIESLIPIIVSPKHCGHTLKITEHSESLIAMIPKTFHRVNKSVVEPTWLQTCEDQDLV
jgi:hypothetical protein